MDLTALLSAHSMLALAAGATAGAGIFVLVVALRGLPPAPPDAGHGAWQLRLKELGGPRGAFALGAGVLVLITTRWVIAAAGAAALVVGWQGLGGAAEERRATARLEGLAIWTESLRDTVAGAVGLEQAIPASQRIAAPPLAEPLARLVDRLHTRMPMPEALRIFADDLNDPSSDLIIAALVINARLRGPGLRDLLGALSASVREELDMRRKVTAQRRSTRRSVQIVVGVSVGMAFGLAIFNRGYVRYYNSALGQLVLAVVVGLYAASFFWLRRLAKFQAPERLLSQRAPISQQAGALPAAQLPGARVSAPQLPGAQVPGAEVPGQPTSLQLPGAQVPGAEVPGQPTSLQLPRAQVPGAEVPGQPTSLQLPRAQVPGAEVPGQPTSLQLPRAQVPGAEVPAPQPTGPAAVSVDDVAGRARGVT
jgi:Flp pilus assembly protein TadB